MESVKYLKLVLPVRYENEDMPKDMPFRNEDIFEVIYDIKTGDILNYSNININVDNIVKWNKEFDRVSANLLEDCLVFELNDLKVTDEGSYYLLDENLNVLYSIERDYVPDSHSVDGEYGDYINLHIDFNNGKILNLKQDATFEEFLRS